MTFLKLSSEFCDRNRSKFHIVPIPYAGTVCFQQGTDRGPRAILEVSDQMEHFDEELRTEFYRPGIYTHPEIPAAETPEQEMSRIYEKVRELRLFQDGRFPIFLGGEHSISAPLVQVASETVPDLSVLQLDAHADLREEYTGGRYSHASVMRRILEITPHIVQVGIRSFSAEEYTECPEQIARCITPESVTTDFQFSLDRILFGLTENVYITIDVDVFDPGIAPGVGTPEPGGLNWRDVLAILREVFARKNVIGADVVETLPLGGQQITTEFLAARLVGKIIAYAGKGN
ncbi:MAG: agmatinase [Thermoguttaceae bacterium]